jgi:dipeptidyl aminopeptidase/acylaminoacyl peptidase
MLLVGELDDNVDPASTIQLCDALIKANKDFELVDTSGDESYRRCEI